MMEFTSTLPLSGLGAAFTAEKSFATIAGHRPEINPLTSKTAFVRASKSMNA